jgi:hypothetical protein
MYCRQEHEKVRSEAHAIPESLCRNDHVLPAGAICDSCNSYFPKLDNALVLHEQIWLAIQVMGLPGKKGKPRMELGWMWRRDRNNPNEVTIEGRGKNPLFIKGNHIRIEALEAPGWNLMRFKRALHYVALNVLAVNSSPEHVLDSRYDRVRKYVRYPRKNEQWACGEFQRSKILLNQIDFQKLQAPGEVIGLGLFHYLFIVDLLGSMRFAEWLKGAIPDRRMI